MTTSAINPDAPREHVFTSDPKTMTWDQIQAKINQPARTYDQELDDPIIHNPAVAANLKTMSERYQTSTTENIDMALMQYELSYCDEGTRRQRWPGQERWMGKEAEEMRVVRIMHPYMFLRKLRSAGVDARPEEHKNARIWLNSFSRVGRIGVNAWTEGEMQTVTTLQYPYAPEYSVMRFNEYDVPQEEKYRGWRTTLLTLVVRGVVTEEEAMKAFGPAVGPASEFYREQMQTTRRVKLGLQL